MCIYSPGPNKFSQSPAHLVQSKLKSKESGILLQKNIVLSSIYWPAAAKNEVKYAISKSCNCCLVQEVINISNGLS